MKKCVHCGKENVDEAIFCADCGLKGYKNFIKDVSIDEGTQRVLDYWNDRK